MKTLVASVVGSIISVNAHAGDTSGNLGLYSQYRGWDGETISSNPYIQGDITHRFDNGANIGLWGSKNLSSKEGDEINYHIGYDKELGKISIGGSLILADAPHVGKPIDVINYYGYLQYGGTTISTLTEDSQIGGKTGWGISGRQNISDHVSIILQGGEHKFTGDDYGLVRLSLSEEILGKINISLGPQYKEGGESEGFGIMGNLSHKF